MRKNPPDQVLSARGGEMGETKYHIPPSQQRRIASEMAGNAKTKKELVEAARVAGVG